MASTDSMPVPKKGVAFRVDVYMEDAVGDPVTGFTSPDSEVSKDGFQTNGTTPGFSDCTNEVTYVGHGFGYLDLTATEMNADMVRVHVTCTEGHFGVTIVPEEVGDIRANAAQIGGTSQTGRDIGASVLLSSGTGTGQISLSSGKVTADVDTIKTNPVVNAGTVTFPTGATLASTTNITAAAGIAVASIATDAVSAASVAAAAVTKIQSGLATPTNITAGTITTVTNLTNAPTSGDLTATMKTSVTAAVPTAAQNATAVENLSILSSIESNGAANANRLISVLAQLGSFTGTGVNTILGFLQAMFRKDAPVPSDIGGTFDPATDSVEAIRERADALATPADVNAQCDQALTDYDGPTNAEMVARTLPSASYAEPGDEMALVDAEDVYPADIQCTIDESNSKDEYTVQWFRNGAPVVSGVTVPLIQVVKRADGSDLIASTAMTQIGSTGAYKYDATTDAERNTAGEAVLVHVSATINGSTRTWRKLITRDSAAA